MPLLRHILRDSQLDRCGWAPNSPSSSISIVNIGIPVKDPWFKKRCFVFCAEDTTVPDVEQDHGRLLTVEFFYEKMFVSGSTTEMTNPPLAAHFAF